LLQVILDWVRRGSGDRRRVDGDVVLIIDERETQCPRRQWLLWRFIVVRVIVRRVVRVIFRDNGSALLSSLCGAGIGTRIEVNLELCRLN
jgi:hypothetical protein